MQQNNSYFHILIVCFKLKYMRKILSSIFSLFIFTCFSYSQHIIPPTIQWEKTYGGKRFDEAFDVIEDMEEHIVIVGQAKHFDSGEKPSKSDLTKGGNDDLLFIKLNRQGGILKIRTIGRSKSEGAYAIIQTFDGGYAIAGYTNSPGENAIGNKDAWLLKVDKNGDFLWEKRMGSNKNDEFTDIIQDSEGRLILTGQKDENLLVTMIDRNGKLIWSLTPLKIVIPSKGNALVQLENKDIIVVGKTINRKKEKALILRLNERGEMVGDKKVYGKFSEEAVDVLLTKEKKLAILCRTYSRSKQDDIWVLHTDQSGALLSKKPFQTGFRNRDIPTSFVESFAGNFYITGGSKSHDSNAKRSKYFLCSLNKDGNELFKNWEFYGGNYTDKANKIIQTNNGSLLIVGHTFSKNKLGNNSDSWLLKLHSKGFPTKEKPSNLQVSNPQFFDKNEDQVLQPNEGGYITFKLSNNGDVDAFQIEAYVEPSNKVSELEFIKKINIGYLPCKTSRLISIPIKGKEGLEASETAFTVNLKAANEAEIPPFNFSVKTIADPKPELVITNHQFSPSQKVSRNTPTSLRVTLTNEGNKKATNIRGVFSLKYNVSFYSDKTINVKELAPGESYTFEATFEVKNVFIGDQTKIGFRFHASERNYSYGVQKDFPLAIKEKTFHKEENYVSWEWDSPKKRDFRGLLEKTIPVDIKLDIRSTIEFTKDHFEVFVDGMPLAEDAKSGEEKLKPEGNKNNRLFSFDYENQILLKEGNRQVYVRVQKDAFVAYSDTIYLSYKPNSVDLHLLAIGIGEYESTNRLKYPSNDVQDIARIFQSQEGIVFEKVHSQMICDQCENNETSKAVLETSINKFFDNTNEKFKQNDVVIIYISSHGKNVKGRFKILPSNYKNDYYDPNGDIYTIDFKKYILDQLKPLDINHRFVFIDACHSGAINNIEDLDDFTGVKDSDEEAQSIILKKLIESSKYLRPMMSCNDQEYSYEHQDWKNGAFTEALIEAFKNKKVLVKNGVTMQASTDKVLTFNEIYDFLRLRVPYLVSKNKDYKGRIQTPYTPELLLKEAGDLPFFKIN